LSYGQVEGLDLKRSLSEQLTATKPARERPAVALEGPVDPETYVLGPGDRLALWVWGGIEVHYTVVVGPDGAISIPTLGELSVAGKTVRRAEEMCIAAARPVYPRSEISLRLTGIRSMKVQISGAVVEPGVYELSAVDRLSTLIFAAGGFIKPESEKGEEESGAEEKPPVEKKERIEPQRFFPSLRHIRVVSCDGRCTGVDYLRFQRTGDPGCNPVLRDGDRVIVPAVDVEVGVLDIFGEVKIPGEYEYVRGDRLRDLIELAGGFKSDASLNDIAVVRFREDDFSTREIEVDLEDPEDRGPPLMPDDRVFVRRKTDYRRKFHVTVKGEVRYGGVYPIAEDTTKLTEVIAACGGFTDRANLKGATVTRLAMAEVKDPEFERLKDMSVAEMTDMEYEYFKTRSREEAPAVVVDFVRLFVRNDLAQDITLRDGDVIEVPTLSPTVNVAGQVNSPGLVRYVPGENYEYYIEKAGGFSWNARKRKMRIIKAQTGKWIKPKRDTPIEIGDTIFIPEKQEIDYWELWKDILMVASQVATIIIVIQSVVR